MKITYSLPALSLAATAVCGCAEPSVEKPNVLLISVDDLNDWIGAYGGHPQSITPNMDRLFEQGVIFTNAHTSQAVSTASRNSLLSGLHPATTGWYASTSTYRTNYDDVMAGNMMLPEYFKHHGYGTYCVGKVFHNGDCDFPGRKEDFWTECAPHFWNKMEAWIEDNGYGYQGKMFYPFPEGGGQFVKAYGAETINRKYRETNRFYSLCGGPLSDDMIPEKGMYDEQIAAWASKKILEESNSPFFLAVGFIRPHVPYTAPEKYFEKFNIDSLIMPDVPEDEMSDIPLFGKTFAYGASDKGDWWEVQQVPNAHRELVQAYLAAINFVDEQIGKVIDALEKSGKMDNTIIVLYGDHGQHLGEKRHFRKQTLWEEATRVPLFIRIPRATDIGKRSNTPVSLLDIYPTLVDACGLPENEKNEGHSLVPIVSDTRKKSACPVLSCWYYKNFAVRSEEWRYILYRDGSEELYDHRNDQGEHVNLANDPRYEEVKAELRKYIPENPALPAGSKQFEGDKYQRLFDEWSVSGAPEWLM